MSQPLAYLFPEFLESPEARPIRILAEYLEPLRRFHDQRYAFSTLINEQASMNFQVSSEFLGAVSVDLSTISSGCVNRATSRDSDET